MDEDRGSDAGGSIAALNADHVERLALGAAAPDQPHGLLQAIDEVGRETIGQSLFTAMVFDEATITVERIYSSDAAAYPIGGRKPKRDTAWGRHVLLERRVFVGEGEAAIREAFTDYETIFGLGLRSIVNVPVVFGGRCLGTLNFLWHHADVHPRDVAITRLLALAAVAGFVAHANA